MKIYRFDPEIGKEDGQHGSVKAIISAVIQLDERTEINAVYIHPNERIRVQQAMSQQLFLLVDGRGWVKNEAGKKVSVTQGQAVFWEENELPESGTESGMTAVIIGNVQIDPDQLMPLLWEDKT